MSTTKIKDNPDYPLGTAVWVKLFNRIWWPGLVVDPLKTPKDLLDFANGVNTMVVVKFEHENKYEVVLHNQTIFLYTCDRKMEFVERGYSMYKTQMKGLPIIGNIDMNNFKKDVIFLERLIGGDTSIFIKIDLRQEEVRAAKQIFTPTNTKKSKKKEVGRKSLSVPKTPKTTKTPKTPKTPKTSKTPKTPKTLKTQPTVVCKPRTAPLPRSAPRLRISPRSSKVGKASKPTPSTAYSCHSRVGCNFTTNRYTNLKRHMELHKDDAVETDDSDVVPDKKPSTRSTSNKRKNLRSSSSEIKKQKLQEELLKDWENDLEDEVDPTTVQSTSKVQSSSDVVHSIEEVPTTSGVQSSNNVVQLSKEEVVQTTSEAIPTRNVLSSKNDVISTINKDIPTTSELQETITISNEVFNFCENDNNTSAVELVQSKSDCSPTVDDDILDTFESPLTLDFINNTIFEASPKKTLIVEKTTEDSFNKPHDIHSNELDDQTRSTELLLDKTVNVLDQINNFENSLSMISDSIHESDANILTEDNNIVINTSEPCDLEEPTSLNKTIHTESNGMGIPLVENVSIETKDHGIVEENTNNKEIVSNDVEVNQSNGTTIDKDIRIENSCSVDSTSNKMECEEKIAKKKVSLPNTEWTKEEGWESYTQSGMTEAYETIEADEMLHDPGFDNFLARNEEEVTLNLEFQTAVTSQIQENNRNQQELHFIIGTPVELILPLSYGTHPSLEELIADPLTAVLQKKMSENQILTLTINE